MQNEERRNKTKVHLPDKLLRLSHADLLLDVSYLRVRLDDLHAMLDKLLSSLAIGGRLGHLFNSAQYARVQSFQLRVWRLGHV